MDTGLQGLFQAFSIKCVQLRKAVDQGQDDLVRLVDRELEPIIGDILSYQGRTPEEVHTQLQFIATLIREEADDKAAVIRRATAMSSLLDRYILGGTVPISAGDRSPPAQVRTPLQDVYDQSLFNEAILDSLPDRVGVITRDYRYLFTNQINARILNRSPLSMIGCHVSEFIGEESFRTQAKPAFDRCFAGEKIDYVHHGYRNKREFATRCRMTPLRASNNQIIGAVIVLQNAEEMVVLERG